MGKARIDFRQEIGIGTDIESIARFRKLDQTHHQTFLQRIYTPQELSYCFAKEYPAQHLAVRFAAKEAVLKALGVLGVRGAAPFPLNTIEIHNDKEGIPSVSLTTAHDEKFCLKVSLSHDQDKALAFALAIRST